MYWWLIVDNKITGTINTISVDVIVQALSIHTLLMVGNTMLMIANAMLMKNANTC